MNTERWKAVPEYEGLYEVSDFGRVKSLDRVTNGGRQKGMIRRLTDTPSGHLCVSLSREGVQKTYLVHRLVLRAFVSDCPPDTETRHLNDDPKDNRLANLRWGSRPENMLDRVRNGRHHNAIKTHCKYGHMFTPENTIQGHRSRRCRTCGQRRQREYLARRKLKSVA